MTRFGVWLTESVGKDLWILKSKGLGEWKLPKVKTGFRASHAVQFQAPGLCAVAETDEFESLGRQLKENLNLGAGQGHLEDRNKIQKLGKLLRESLEEKEE